MKRSKLYDLWANMLRRCENPRHPSYADYGGRGIKVCKAWHRYTKFHEWALTHGYASELSIDRKNNNRGYCPSNCRFATAQQQSQNKRRARNNRTGYIGVSLHKESRLYRAMVSHGGKRLTIGYHRTSKAAACQRDAFVKRHYDRYATLNFNRS